MIAEAVWEDNPFGRLIIWLGNYQDKVHAEENPKSSRKGSHPPPLKLRRTEGEQRECMQPSEVSMIELHGFFTPRR